MKYPLLISALLTSTALADTWTVDDDGKADFDNIQAAVDAASDGDEIVVMPGTYTNIATGKDVWINSLYGPKVTIISGKGGPVFSGSGGTTIEGFTITGGSNNEGGGFSIGNGGSPTIINCIIESNHASKGGGLYVQNGSAHLIDCSIINNTCGGGSSRGGGLHLNWSSVILDNCIVEGNGGGESGAAEMVFSNLTLNNCKVSNNSGGGLYAGAIRFYGGASGGSINNCEISNHATAVFCYQGGTGFSNNSFCNNDINIQGGAWTDNGGNTFEDECPICPDVNSDGIIDPNDIMGIIWAWGTCDTCSEDLNEDGVVNLNDLMIVIDSWGMACE